MVGRILAHDLRIIISIVSALRCVVLYQRFLMCLRVLRRYVVSPPTLFVDLIATRGSMRLRNNALLKTLCFDITALLALATAPAPLVNAQTETTLYTFTGNEDGANPSGALVGDSNGNYFGTNFAGGLIGGNCHSIGCGNVFELSPDGHGGWTEKSIYDFTGGPDGAEPVAGVIFDESGNLYGTAEAGGYTGNSRCGSGVAPGCGVVFKLSPTLSGTWTETTLYQFKGRLDGYLPTTRLAFDGSGNLYGTANLGGPRNVGGVFQLSPNGSGGYTFKGIHPFTNGPDGGRAWDITIDAGGTLYVATSQGGITGGLCGGSAGCGAVIALSSNGSGFVQHVVHDFTGHGDGSGPAGLTVDAQGNVFGVTQFGGDKNCLHGFGCGTVFEFSPVAGGGWLGHVIYQFHNTGDGLDPVYSPTLDAAGNLYGAFSSAAQGCPSNCGGIYKLSPVTGGWSETVLYNFTAGADGWEPNAPTLDNAGNLFGTTLVGGDGTSCIPDPNGCGIAFEIAP